MAHLPAGKLILVDPTSTGHPLAYGQSMLDTVNDCTRRDGIRLCRRSNANTADTEEVALLEPHPDRSDDVGAQL